MLVIDCSMPETRQVGCHSSGKNLFERISYDLRGSSSCVRLQYYSIITVSLGQGSQLLFLMVFGGARWMKCPSNALCHMLPSSGHYKTSSFRLYFKKCFPFDLKKKKKMSAGWFLDSHLLKNARKIHLSIQNLFMSHLCKYVSLKYAIKTKWVTIIIFFGTCLRNVSQVFLSPCYANPLPVHLCTCANGKEGAQANTARNWVHAVVLWSTLELRGRKSNCPLK